MARPAAIARLASPRLAPAETNLGPWTLGEKREGVASISEILGETHTHTPHTQSDTPPEGWRREGVLNHRPRPGGRIWTDRGHAQVLNGTCGRKGGRTETDEGNGIVMTDGPTDTRLPFAGLPGSALGKTLLLLPPSSSLLPVHVLFIPSMGQAEKTNTCLCLEMSERALSRPTPAF